MFKRRQWGNWARWGLGLGAVFAVVAACSSNSDEPEGGGGAANGGKGGVASGGKGGAPNGGKGGVANGGNGGALPNGGNAGELHGGAGSDGGMSGAGGCGFEDECGGCEEGYMEMVCSWGVVDIDRDVATSGDEQAFCTAGREVVASQGAGGGGGVAGASSAETAGAAGASRGVCDSYVPLGDVIIGCGHPGGCADTVHEHKGGECVINGECCIIVGRMECGV